VLSPAIEAEWRPNYLQSNLKNLPAMSQRFCLSLHAIAAIFRRFAGGEGVFGAPSPRPRPRFWHMPVK